MAVLDDDTQELVREFLIESREGLDRLDQELVALEDDPANTEILSGVFRTFHTIKGTAGFLAFARLEKVAHSAENLLSKLRDGTLVLTPDRASTLLRTVDALRSILANIESTNEEGDASFDDLLAELARAQSAEVPGAAPAAQPTEPEAVAAPSNETAQLAEAPATARSTAGDTTIRVDVGLLDSLMNLVGELVLARNQILQHTTADLGTTLNRTTQRLDLITSDLQEGVMKTRMQPIKNAWSKFPRVVRDLTRACGKKAALRMEGEDTELDRTILEAIKDPLTHMVRNSVDHGLESPEERIAAGKPEEGLLSLRAYHEGGQVILEIADDGKGIDVARVGEKAVERGIVSRDKLARMTEREVLQLVFLPGFSTAAKVTNVSGRGVGMDVVRTHIEKIGGTVDIQSAAGVGTTLRIKIPLTLAIIPALLVTIDGSRFAIPQVNLVELVRLEGARSDDAVEFVHGTPVYRLRGELLPLVDLRAELDLPERDATERDASRALNIVVLQADDRQYGLVVDVVNDTEEIVVKPLSQQIRDIPVYAGATILGDGRVALILDTIGIAHRARAFDDHPAKKRAKVEAGAHAATSRSGASEWTSMLLLEIDEDRAAIPLSDVARLEEIALADVEQSGDAFVTQYRDSIMPLVWLGRSHALASPPADGAGEPLQVVVHAVGDRCIGLVVDRIHDIVEAQIRVESTASRGDSVGSAIVHGHVTNLLDVPGIVRQCLPKLHDAAALGGGLAS